MGKFIATLAVIFLVYIAYVALTGGGVSDDVSNAECEMTLCCPDCDVISVTRVIDGDTFVSGGDRVRLFGMDTPEIGEPCYSEATARLHELAKDTVRVESGPRARDPFDRLIFYIYRDSGDSIDELLVREGYARGRGRGMVNTEGC